LPFWSEVTRRVGPDCAARLASEAMPETVTVLARVPIATWFVRVVVAPAPIATALAWPADAF
jgi:hypothetical protein